MSRDWVRLSVAETIAMCDARVRFPFSEKRTRPGAIHVRPLALGSHSRGSPPTTGTTQVSPRKSYRRVRCRQPGCRRVNSPALPPFAGPG